MKGINEFTAYQIKHWNAETQTIDGWKLCRPIGRGGLMRRVKKAWKVFTGKADVLIWHKQ